jgi:hypothetical protein
MQKKQLERLKGKGRVTRRREHTDIENGNWWGLSRRQFIITGGALVGGLAVAGGGLWLVSRDDSSDVDQDSLELQHSSGWNVGSEDKKLNFTGVATNDSQGNSNWNRFLDQSALLTAYQPRSEQWMPFFVPTLIQSIQFETLRSQMNPIFTPDMQEAYGRGQAIGKDFIANAQNKGEVAIIADLPGRAAVAFGAGLADAARVVATFDNFPHPLGVTPSHETLGAMLYYAGEIEGKQQNVPADAPAVFLLDSNRLNQYSDADNQFDNRYLAKLPSAQKLQEMGVKSILYVTPDRARTQELDDLNEDFVEFKEKGLNVAMLPLSDLVRSSESASTGSGGSWDDSSSGSHYYYGGNPLGPIWLFYAYPLFRPYPAYASRYSGAFPSGGTVSRPPLAPPGYTPVNRPTIFSGSRVGSARTAGVGRSKPSGFGRSTVRVTPSGQVVGTRAGRSGFYSPGRSGSFGRGGTSGG